ncbi:actin [Plasmodium falciparum Dd2]|uniref:Actin n=1 Tax=Plasmodium falciparum (isolate Dd2) TaxID=57267 RepID=A0A0L7M0P1_PLAF4|nr:actin [Plasmodium falciparum Dd2]
MKLKNDENVIFLCGGEDIFSLVVDLGFYSCKIGHNQEDTPRIFLNSICGEREMNDEYENYMDGSLKNINYKELKYPLNLYNRNENIRIKPLFYKDDNKDDIKLNADVFEKILEYSIEGIEIPKVFECTDDIIMDPIKLGGLNLNFEEHPILLTEFNMHNHKIREQMTEILFEKYNIPALYFAKKAKLTSFSLGRSTSLVIDIGYNSLDINPVYEGYVLQKNSLEYNIGGQYFDKLIYEQLIKDNVNIIPYFVYCNGYDNMHTCFNDNINGSIHNNNHNNIGHNNNIDNINHHGNSNTYQENSLENSVNPFYNIHHSYKEECILDVIRYMKESVCRTRIINDDSKCEEKKNSIQNITNLNEQNNIHISNENNIKDACTKEEFFELPDGYKINIHKYKYDIAEHLFHSIPSLNNFKGLPQSIINCIISTDVDIRKELLQSIVITGGSSLFPGLIERLHNSLKEKECFTQSNKFKILNMTSLVEQKYSSWLGGSILASLGTFQQMWVSKKEYHESGHNIILDRCF